VNHSVESCQSRRVWHSFLQYESKCQFKAFYSIFGYFSCINELPEIFLFGHAVLRNQQNSPSELTRNSSVWTRCLEKPTILCILFIFLGARNSRSDSVYIVITTNGEFVDYYDSKAYNFKSATFERVFKYRVSTGKNKPLGEFGSSM